MSRFTTTVRQVLVPAIPVALVTVAAIVVVLGTARTAAATTTATGTAAVTTASGRWGAVLVTNGHDSVGQPITMSWTLFGAPVYVSARNNGSLPLSGQTYTLTRTGGLGEFTATACIGAAWTGFGTCPTGDTRVLDTTTSGSTSVSLALGTGASVSIKVSAGVAAITTVTLSVGVTRSQARTPTTTNT